MQRYQYAKISICRDNKFCMQRYQYAREELGLSRKGSHTCRSVEELAWNATLKTLGISWYIKTSFVTYSLRVSWFMPYVCKGVTPWILTGSHTCSRSVEKLAWNVTLKMLGMSWYVKTSFATCSLRVSWFMPYVCKGATPWILTELTWCAVGTDPSCHVI